MNEHEQPEEGFGLYGDRGRGSEPKPRRSAVDDAVTETLRLLREREDEAARVELKDVAEWAREVREKLEGRPRKSEGE